MATTTESLGKTIELMFDVAVFGAEKTYQKVKSSASEYLRAMFKGIALLFLVMLASMILKAYTGIVGFAYVGVFLCFALAVVVAFWGAPIGIVIGMLKGETLNPAVAGESYVRGILTMLFVMILAFLYVIEIPIENNPSALPLLMICGTALVIGIYLWGSWIPPKLYTLLVMGTMFLTTLSLFNIRPLDYVLGNSSSTYLGVEYPKNQPIIVHNAIDEFSEPVTLNSEYEPKFLGWAKFLPENSNKPIMINSDKQRYTIPSRKIRVQTEFGSITFVPINK